MSKTKKAKSNRPKTGKKKSRKSASVILWILILSALALAICIVLVWFVFFRSSGNTQELQQKWYKEAADDRILGWDVHGTSGDRDDDGTSDADEILKTAKIYVRSHPQYESRYYPLGYPNDGYGVCTDVVDFALLRAGFDMQALVDRDARENPDAYPRIDEPDKKIDFRRVVNLDVYFRRHAISLTTDLGDKEAWQGGDIVVFPGHIGIISNRRNLRGVPFVLHHAGPGQQVYEQDILGLRKVTGHYRIG